jgi:hypothetical protein
VHLISGQGANLAKGAKISTPTVKVGGRQMFKRTNLKNWLVIIAFLLAVQYSVGPQAWAGSIVGWGEQVTPTSQLACISAVSAGDEHSLAIKEVAPPLIEAEMKLTPDTLNLQSKGRWIMCLIRLPEDHNATDIDPNSILLEDEVPADRVWLLGRFAVAKFSRRTVKEMLAELETPAEVELLVTGELSDGTIFEGTDTIRAIDKGRKSTR